MAQRDYVGRGQTSARRKKTTKNKSKKAAKGLPLTTLIAAIAIVALFIGGLYFITHDKKEAVETTPTITGQHPANSLPPKPQERWQYIKELENRQVGTPLQPEYPSSGSQINPKATLSPEQLRFLQQIEADKRQPAVQLPEVPYNGEVPRSLQQQHLLLHNSLYKLSHRKYLYPQLLHRLNLLLLKQTF